MPDVRVSLKNGQISVDPSTPVNVSKKGHETVTWLSTDGPFGIEFAPGAQIDNPVITQNGSTWRGTAGPFGDDVPEGKKKYDVTAPGLPVLDPELDIKP